MRIVVLLVIILSSLGVALGSFARLKRGGGFKPPSIKARAKALGNVEQIPLNYRILFEETEGFKPKSIPAGADWLATHAESGQTFEQFVRSKPNSMKGERTRLYIMPSGEFSARAPSLKKLIEFARAYFACDVELLPALDLKSERITSRINAGTGKKQLLTLDLNYVSASKLPKDGYALLNVTMSDLYPSPSWNYVFGEATLKERVGVFSFARYDPAFYGINSFENADRIVLKRSMKVLAHEMSHMFGIHHCIYYQCSMNGSNHLKESDSIPIHMCPVDLRKLQYIVGFDPVKRYSDLKNFYEKEGFTEEADWVESRISSLVY